jgi:hypothetical protein
MKVEEAVEFIGDDSVVAKGVKSLKSSLRVIVIVFAEILASRIHLDNARVTYSS